MTVKTELDEVLARVKQRFAQNGERRAGHRQLMKEYEEDYIYIFF